MDHLHFGNEDGEKLAVLPGLALKSVMGLADGIVSAYAPLAKNYDIYLFDHIREEPQGYSIEGMARDTLAAFAELGIERVHIIGVSLGGMVAQAIALSAPEKVSSLVLTSTTMRPKDGNRAVLAEWEALAKRRDTAGLMASFGENVYSPSFYERFKDVIVTMGEDATGQDFRNFLVSLEAVANFDTTGEVGRISCPVLVIGAEEGRILGVQASYDLIEALNCEYYIYEGYGHAVYDEAPDYLARVESFLRGLGPSSR